MRREQHTRIAPGPRLRALDVVAVIVFVVIGRDTHEGGTGPADVLATAAPFLLGLLPGWAAGRLTGPLLSVRSGVTTAGVAASVGLAVRRLVFGDGIATPFILVTASFLVASFVGWRLVVASIVDRRRSTP